MIYDKRKLVGRTYIQIANQLFNMGKSLEGSIDEAISEKQDKLTAGSGIRIDSNNVISATGGGGGGGVDVDTELNTESTNPVENKAIAIAISNINLENLGLTYTDIIIDD